MSTTTPSPRQQLAERIAEFIREHDLNNPFGGEVRKDGRYYAVMCAVPRYLDGLIRVYGPTFILVELQGPLVSGAYRGIYQSEADAPAFLKALLVGHDEDAAYAVPAKPEAA